MGTDTKRNDREEVAKQLLEWAKKDSSINLCEFCVEFCKPMIQPSLLYKWGCEDPVFRKTYELAKSFIAYRRERKLNTEELHVKAYDLNARAYDFFLDTKKQKEAQENAEATVKAKQALEAEKAPANTDTNIIVEQLLEQMKELQEENKKLKQQQAQ